MSFQKLLSITPNQINEKKIKKILILYDLGYFYIGDTCLEIARLKKTKLYYENACIDVNTVNTHNYNLIQSILANSPYINSYTNLKWSDLSFEDYDIILTACIPEIDLVDFLNNRYGASINSSSFKPVFFTVSGSLDLEENRYGQSIFPININYINYQLSHQDNISMLANEIFITDDEILWAKNWLSSNGVINENKLFLLFDSASSKDKLLKLDVYFDILSKLSTNENTKVMIFDEKRLGKKKFYLQWLGESYSEKLIFVEGLSLRQTFSIIASPAVKLIFGPSTGLMHCASGIYNIISQKMKNKSAIPIMIAYTGKVLAGFNENVWWNNSLVETIFPMKIDDGYKLEYVRKVNYKELADSNLILPCQAIDSSAIINFINAKIT